jgi:uncharacterized membrane protein
MNDLLGYTVLILLGNENFLVMLATFLISMALFMTILYAWKYKRKE